jgi:hypothetical protein
MAGVVPDIAFHRIDVPAPARPSVMNERFQRSDPPLEGYLVIRKRSVVIIFPPKTIGDIQMNLTQKGVVLGSP